MVTTFIACTWCGRLPLSLVMWLWTDCVIHVCFPKTYEMAISTLFQWELWRHNQSLLLWKPVTLYILLYMYLMMCLKYY